MSSAVDICNRALSLIGNDIPILSLEDNTKQGKVCKEAYEPCLTTLLRSFPWSFAVHRYSLAATLLKPAFGEGLVFQVPSDCLRVFKPAERGCQYTVEGDKIISDSNPFNFYGIKYITDTTLFDSEFEKCLTYLIATEICMVMTTDSVLKNKLFQEYNFHLTRAKETSSMDRTGVRYNVHGFLDSREVGVF